MERTESTSTKASSSGDLTGPVQLPVDPLTPAEQQILALVARGLFNQEVAARLDIAVGTVKWHLHQVFEKLAARNRTEAVAKARERGLLSTLTA
jgi:LuxR family maltose regulon positive regulatory protein